MNTFLLIAVLALCPLMHFWMMRHHGSHKEDQGNKEAEGGEKHVH